MSKTIRIGTRDSELALWQAKTVRKQLEALGHHTELVPVKSTGDLVLDKPLYEMGITGIFTRTLDIALLNEDIDIAVHSLKDVPTVLPHGIVQAAVLKRGNVNDTLVFKKNEEFLGEKEAIIATGSLRRKAQWLNRYPSHTIVDLRGNVNTRLQKLRDNESWNAAIFAAAGLGRLGLRSREAINLDWMIPAPAQGAIMITALDSDADVRAICAEINHEETEICTSVERRFLNLLEGGCTAPIGALARIREDDIIFNGVLLSQDGSKKIEINRTEKLSKYEQLAQYCADYILERGGKHLMNERGARATSTTVYSTKRLTPSQMSLFHNGISVDSSDFIQISMNRLVPKTLRTVSKHVVITSKNGVESLTTNFTPEDLQFENIYCVGRRTKRLIEQKIGPVKHVEKNARLLAGYLVDQLDDKEVTYFCSNLRLDDLPSILEQNQFILNEVEAYETKLAPVKLDEGVEGIMFFSPSTVKSYIKANTPQGIAYCIGESTAKEARHHFKDVRVAKVPTVESVIELVNENYI